MSTQMRWLGLLMCGSLVLAGCGGDESSDRSDTSNDDDDHATAGHDGGTHGDEDDGELPEAACTAAYPEYQAGKITTKAGDLTVRLVSASPAPPLQKVANDFTLEITNADGTPAEDATIVDADSWMPVHAHGGRKDPKVKKLEAGQFLLDDIDFRMLGPWQIRLQIKASASDAPQQAILQVCVK